MIPRSVVTLAVMLFMVLASTARADVLWIGAGTDPSDIAFCGSADKTPPCLGFDIRSTAVRIVRADNGRRYLIVSLRSYTRPNNGWKSMVWLDTRGDRRADRRVFLNNPLYAAMPQPLRCAVNLAERGSKWRGGIYRVRTHGKVASCRFPVWRFAPHKRPIRWHVTTNYLFPEPFRTLDLAPDLGWYP